MKRYTSYPAVTELLTPLFNCPFTTTHLYAPYFLPTDLKLIELKSKIPLWLFMSRWSAVRRTIAVSFIQSTVRATFITENGERKGGRTKLIARPIQSHRLPSLPQLNTWNRRDLINELRERHIYPANGGKQARQSPKYYFYQFRLSCVEI